MRRIALITAVFILISFSALVSCNRSELPNGTENSNRQNNTEEVTEEMTAETKKETQKVTDKPNKEQLLSKTKISPTSYRVEEIKNVSDTVSGSFDKWQGEVIKNGKNNDNPTENSVIFSPFHTLEINGIEVPVYTARCGKGAHSFAWVDITSDGSFLLDVSLSLSVNVRKCVILPLSNGTEPELSGNTVKCEIDSTGSFTFTFSDSAEASVTDPVLAPLTLMVCRSERFSVPSGYKTVETEPGYHENNELIFTEERAVYVIKKGFHDISSISLPSNSVLFIEQGAYIQVTDRKNANGSNNTDTAIHADYVNNVSIISRGLLDCGKLMGGDGKYKHVVNAACSKDVTIRGLTVINANTWTICAYDSQSPVIEQNLLLSYRTYSDGIMMSECVGGIGRNNFVRTGDDAVEFKGTGWWSNGKTGSACVYENNAIWTDKGAGYCLTWESARPMNNMIFRNNSIGFAQPTWTERNTAIDCLLGTNPETSWSDITFENIEIYHVISPNVINIQVDGEGAKLENITFRNIYVFSAEKNVHAFRMKFSAKRGFIKNITLQNISFCNNVLTQKDISNSLLFCNEASKYFEEISIENN